MIEARTLAGAPGVRHGFFTRGGGVSEGVFASLNCGLGSGDAPTAVIVNRARAMARLGLAETALATCYQVHSARAVTVEAPWPHGGAPPADGLATRAPGIALGVLTADCAPVLLADPEARVVGAAHGGWRGALAGVIETTVAAMERLGAARGAIRAAIGPCIAQASYEVGPELFAQVLADDPGSRRLFAPATRPGHLMFDLAGYVARRLARLGLGSVEAVGGDTYVDETRFFSYRRALHRGDRDYGRALSAIALEP